MDKLIPIKKSITEIIKVCNTSLRDTTKKNIFENYSPIFSLNSINYNLRILRDDYYSLAYLEKFEEKIKGLDYEDFKKIYEDRFVPEKYGGRIYYNKIMQTAKYGKCPYCGIRPVSTLDHVFPKKNYSVLSVEPLNLVPSCKDCNTGKLTSYHLTDPTVHPYFDDTNTDIWLYCTIINNEFIFSVKKPNNFDKKLFKRIERTFIDMKLANLYAFQANNEYSGIQYMIKNIPTLQGKQQYLSSTAMSWRMGKLNTWQAAMYEEMSTNINFLNSL